MGAVQGHAVAAAHVAQAVHLGGGRGHARPGQGIDEGQRRQALPHARQLRAQEAGVEGRVVGDREVDALEGLEQARRDVGEGGCEQQLGAGDAGELGDGARHRHVDAAQRGVPRTRASALKQHPGHLDDGIARG